MYFTYKIIDSSQAVMKALMNIKFMKSKWPMRIKFYVNSYLFIHLSIHESI